MKAQIICIGDELLIGQTVNTNASWIGVKCSEIGLSIQKILCISDQEEAIIEALDSAISTYNVVFITGGLGPTKDDITKKVMCAYFDTTLQLHLPTLQKIEKYFTQLGRPMLEVNIKQAELPVDCNILNNELGTAAGMWFEKDGTVFISMPGVPYEMKGIMDNEVLPRLKTKFKLDAIYHDTIILQGIGESFLAERLKDWENKLRNSGLFLAYLPSPGIVKLRITSYQGESRKKEINTYFDFVKTQLPKHVFGRADQMLSKVVGDILIEKKATIGTIESCTSGALAAEITNIPGASNYFMGSIVTYSLEEKRSFLDIKDVDLKKHGAVSAEIVEQMATKGRLKLDTDYCISTSGLLGPDGDGTSTTVGTVWIAIADKNGCTSQKIQLGQQRDKNRTITVLTALNMLRVKLLDIK